MSNSRYKSKNEAEKAVSVVSLISSSGEYINGTKSEKFGLLMERTSSSIYLKVKLNNMASVISLFFDNCLKELRFI